MFGGGQDLTNMLLWFAVFFGIIYFIIIRPNSKQQKTRRAMLESLAVNDKIITIGGIHGIVTKINEDTIIVKVANNMEMEFQRSSVQTIENGDYKEQPKSKSRKLGRGKQESTDQENDTTSEIIEASEDQNKLR